MSYVLNAIFGNYLFTIVITDELDTALVAVIFRLAQP